MARVKRTEKKTWYAIIAPKSFHNQVVGEILLSNPSSAVGRIVPVNLANLARDPRRQNITIKLAILTAAGEKLHTETIGYEMSPSFIKRMVRKGGTKIDYSFIVETVDNKKLRLKTVFVTRRKIKISIATSLRKKAEEIIKNDIKKIRFAELMQLIVIHKLQGSLKKQLSKIYPLKSFEVRQVKIEKDKKHHVSEEVKKEEFKEETKPKKAEIKPEPKKEAPKEEKKETKPETKEEVKVEEKKEETPKEEPKTEEKKETSKEEKPEVKEES